MPRPIYKKAGITYLRKCFFFLHASLVEFFMHKMVPDIATKRDYQPEDARFLQKEERGYSVW